MKTSSVVAFAAAIVGASAWNYNASTTYVTDVVTAFTTVCPEATVITYGEHTYTVTESTTLTITNCPCTITRPVVVTSSVYCQSCTAQTTLYPNTTSSSITPNMPTFTTSTTASVPTAGADRAVAFSGAALAALVGLAAFAL